VVALSQQPSVYRGVCLYRWQGGFGGVYNHGTAGNPSSFAGFTAAGGGYGGGGNSTATATGGDGACGGEPHLMPPLTEVQAPWAITVVHGVVWGEMPAAEGGWALSVATVAVAVVVGVAD